MKAEELFVGAIVRVNRDGLCIKKDTIVDVRGVDADDKLIEKRLIGSAHCRPLDDNQFEGGIWCEYLGPIPLTPEILEKNGFKKCDGNEWSFYKKGEGERGLYNILWSADELYLEIASYTPLIGEFNRMGVKYIHELQHALRLCGIEKEIDL